MISNRLRAWKGPTWSRLGPAALVAAAGMAVPTFRPRHAVCDGLAPFQLIRMTSEAPPPGTAVKNIRPAGIRQGYDDFGMSARYFARC
jgi:hypothetical protein